MDDTAPALMSLKQGEHDFLASLDYKVKPKLKKLLLIVRKIHEIPARYFQEGWSHIPSTKKILSKLIKCRAIYKHLMLYGQKL